MVGISDTPTLQSPIKFNSLKVINKLSLIVIEYIFTTIVRKNINLLTLPYTRISNSSLIQLIFSADNPNCTSMSSEEDHRLWVSLSSLGEGNVFAVLPQLLQRMLDEQDMQPEDGFQDVVLPSDDAWQTKIYYKLVEKQRMADSRDRER